MFQTSGQVYHSTKCYHCGESCPSSLITLDEKLFCCEGCKTVYELLKDAQLCSYYQFQASPGRSLLDKKSLTDYTYLDQDEINQKFIRFTNGEQTHVNFFIPKIHCSSCVWLLENLHKLHNGIYVSSVNFLRKEVTIVFNPRLVKVSKIAELLETIGYEPLINSSSIEEKHRTRLDKKSILRIGTAGFCFANIMMLSFPEYLSLGNFLDNLELKPFFGYLNLVLSLPVLFYSASPFFVSAWKNIRQRFLHIDVPIAFAIVVTFIRSVYEIVDHNGIGYLDSMSGIVFFMLIGRYFQHITYDALLFDRDYKSYMPIAVTLIKTDSTTASIQSSKLKKGDRILIKNNEIIPTDARLLSEHTHIDYSFVTGESSPVTKKKNDLIYAGGRQLDGAIELEVVFSTSQSYLTQLWNKDEDSIRDHQMKEAFVHKVNRYFTTFVFSIAILSSLFWLFFDRSKSLDALTAVLIVACPCGLLLTSSFTYGNMLRILGRNKFYLKNSAIIEKLSNVNAIVFDKTGTITHGMNCEFSGAKLGADELKMALSLANQSSHPLSRKIVKQFYKNDLFPVTNFEEIQANGIRGNCNGKCIMLGSAYFVLGKEIRNSKMSTKVFYMMDGKVMGYFNFVNTYREGLERVLRKLSKNNFISLLSGDNDSEKEKLIPLFHSPSQLLFNQKPEDKLHFIEELQKKGKKVVMIGDGLNDLAALKKSDVGISVSDHTNSFTPASDVIMDGESFHKLPLFLDFVKYGNKVISFIFFVSTIYNVIGLVYAVQAKLSPMIAAILMPLSTVTIILLSSGFIFLLAQRKKL